MLLGGKLKTLMAPAPLYQSATYNRELEIWHMGLPLVLMLLSRTIFRSAKPSHSSEPALSCGVLVHTSLIEHPANARTVLVNGLLVSWDRATRRLPNAWPHDIIRVFVCLSGVRKEKKKAGVGVWLGVTPSNHLFTLSACFMLLLMGYSHGCT